MCLDLWEETRTPKWKPILTQRHAHSTSDQWQNIQPWGKFPGTGFVEPWAVLVWLYLWPRMSGCSRMPSPGILVNITYCFPLSLSSSIWSKTDCFVSYKMIIMARALGYQPKKLKVQISSSAIQPLLSLCAGTLTLSSPGMPYDGWPSIWPWPQLVYVLQKNPCLRIKCYVFVCVCVGRNSHVSSLALSHTPKQMC